ncbi:hypothetical protein Pme01_34360 [Planosporangium mesophilum]|uniref:Uncharacterized protein n=1 Tax=Planosporangium mesophilum TaxID=689768 RepID=A0A8J3X1Z0_9ACTN|nr:hypothetical protein Pme01_34360 [Planosporangium mesophilum]
MISGANIEVHPVLRRFAFRDADEQDVGADCRTPDRYPRLVSIEDPVPENSAPEVGQPLGVGTVDHDVANPARHARQPNAPAWLATVPICFQRSAGQALGADLVGLGESAQRDIGKKLGEQCHQARGGDIERSLTTHGATSAGPWLLTAAAVPDGASIDHLPEYIDAKQYQTRSSRSMLLLYETDGSLSGSRYRGEPQPRTADRDAAIEVTQLRSLAATFHKVLPSARRSTRQLRGKRGKKNRRRR